MDRRRNLLIGIVVAIVIVGVSIYATGFTRRLLSPFRTYSANKSSESVPARVGHRCLDKLRTVKAQGSARSRRANRVLDFRLL
jgi:hypothetical protein